MEIIKKAEKTKHNLGGLGARVLTSDSESETESMMMSETETETSALESLADGASGLAKGAGNLLEDIDIDPADIEDIARWVVGG